MVLMSTFALVIAPLALALVFTVAGVAKVTTESQEKVTGARLEGPGVPALVNNAWVRRLHPWGEILVAVGLLAPWPMGLVAAVAALALCLFYTWLVAAVLRAGEPQECACFGRFGRGPATRWDLVRNVGLVALGAGAVVFAATGRSVPSDLLAFGAGDWWWFAAVVVAAAVPFAWRLAAGRPGSARGGNDGAIGVGTPAEVQETAPAPVRHLLSERPAPASLDEAQPEDLTGVPLPKVMVRPAGSEALRGLRQALEGRATLLILMRPSCRACDEVLAELDDWRAAFGDRVAVRLLVSREPERFATEHPEVADLVLEDESLAIQQLLGVRYTPSALLVAPDGSIAAGPTTGAEYISALAGVVADSVPS
ncbi:methylamine utilization protein MauE [Zhihengliuella halotolerans]|uniref:Methylamine utilization protein MauE n=2 Tax=Zhihengliuella halotolerans TaxID=370736 RepID=A0A4Q8AD78_9MICC|nr:methylamine utilization protein MauE [Zhihengliuella halotolerans]